MKKKIVALLLASSMALTLSACGGSGSDSSSSKSDTKTEETVKFVTQKSKNWLQSVTKVLVKWLKSN